MASSYRSAIYRALDDEFDIDWFFSDVAGGIREIDLRTFKSCRKLSTVKVLGKASWQKGVVQLLWSSNYDRYLLLGELSSLSTWTVLLLNFVLKKRIYLWSHGWYGRENFVKKLIKRLFFGLATGTFLYGNFAKKVAISQDNNGGKLYVIHNSLNYEEQLRLRNSGLKSDVYLNYFRNSNPVIMFIGRLTPEKKLEMLINAISECEKRGECLNAVFIGGSNDMEHYKNLVREKKITAWFYGPCYDEKENAELVYNADLCVSPGNVGLTAIHSLMFGTPVITHDNFCNQMPEFEAITEGITGSFFHENDINDLVDKIVLWLHAHNNRDEVRCKCYEVIDREWNPIHQMEIFKNVLK